MRFRNCLGMIWSVSTFARSRGARTPVTWLKASTPLSLPSPGGGGNIIEFPHVDEVPGDCGGRRHWRADEVGPAPTPLPALEIPVAGRGAPLARAEDVGIHAEAHRAASIAPLEAGLAEDRIQSLGLGLPLDAHRSGHDHGPDFRMHRMAAYYRRRQAQIFEAGVGAGADEDAVDRDRFHRRARLERHVG